MLNTVDCSVELFNASHAVKPTQLYLTHYQCPDCMKGLKTLTSSGENELVYFCL